MLVAVPVLAVSAFLRIRRMENRAAGTSSPERTAEFEHRIAGLEKALSNLIGRTDALEREIQARGAVAPPQVVPSPQPQAWVPTWPRPEDSAPKPAVNRGRQRDYENVVAGSLLNYIGMIAILFAVAFFIKYAFDSHWVGPRGRIAVGLITGALLVGWSDLLRRRYRYFSEGIAGLGAAVLYLSIWGGWHYFRILSSGEAFAGMIVVTAMMVVIALGRSSQRIALLALVGGFLTPLLLRTGRDQEIMLFTYLAILSAGMLALESARQWKWLPPLAFAATELYFVSWYETFYAPEKLALTTLYATLFFLLFAAVPLVRGMRAGKLNGAELGVAIVNVLAYLASLRAMLWPEHRWILTAAYLALAAALLVAMRAMPRRAAGGWAQARILFAGLALACVSLAIPARLDHQWLTMAWAVEGVVLVSNGVNINSWKLRDSGLLLFAIAMVRLIFVSVPAPTFLWNERFLSYAVAVACFALACFLVRDIARQFSATERNLFAALAVGANLYALIALSLEIWDFFGRTQMMGLEHWLAQQLGLTVLWTAYAMALIVSGLVRHSAMLRWQALTLFLLVVAKVFLYDLSSLSRFYRILSFLILGVLLITVSFLYQRRLAAQKAEKKA